MNTANSVNPSATPIVDDEHPWLGLVAYTEETQGFFYGRNAEISEIFTRVRENPLTILFGQSGLGKTSLLGAGLIPKLRAERYRPILIRLDFSENAIPITVQTIKALRSVLGIENLPETENLWELIHSISSPQTDLKTHPPVLIFDQFEEIFTHNDLNNTEVDHWFSQISDLIENRPPVPLQEQFRKDRKLARTYDHSPSSVRVVITLREEFLSHLERRKDAMPSLMRNRMAIYRLTGLQALQAATLPGRKGSHPIISDHVGAQIVRKVARKPENTPLEEIEAVPPFLSLLCEQLNATRFTKKTTSKEVTSKLVITHGDDILDSYYESSFNGLPEKIRSYVEDKLVSLGGHRNAVTREDAINELEIDGVADPNLAIDALIARRLLTSEERRAIPHLELTHDVLTPLVTRSRSTRHEREALLLANRQKKRQMLIVSSLIGVVVILVGLAGFGWDSYRRAERETRISKVTLSRSDYLLGIELVEKGDTLQGLAYLASSIRKNPDSHNTSAATQAVGLLLERSFPLPLSIPMRHENTINSATFSPDASMVVTASEDHTARVWDAYSGKPASPLLQHDNSVNSATFSPDGSALVTASSDNTARVWDISKNQAKLVLQHNDRVNTAEFSTDGSKILTASDDHTARIWEINSSKASLVLQHEDTVNTATFNHDSSRVVTASDDGTARIWDATTGSPVSNPMVHNLSVISAVFGPNNTKIITVTVAGKFQVWDSTTGKSITKSILAGSYVNSATFSPDGTKVVTASGDNTARIFDAETGAEILKKPMHHKHLVTSAVYSSDGTKILTSSLDGTARIWDAFSGKPITESIPHGGIVTSAKFVPDTNDTILTISDNYSAQTWIAERVKPLTENYTFGDSITLSAFSSDGSKIVTASENKTMRVWNTTTGEPLTDPMAHDSIVKSIFFNKSNDKIVSISTNKYLYIWDISSGELLTDPILHDSAVISVSFDSDGKRFATASFDQTVRIWDIATGSPLTDPIQYDSSITSITFTPDVSRIVTVAGHESISTRDASTGALLDKPKVFEEGVRLEAFNQDGTMYATSVNDRTLQIWDTQTRTLIGQPMKCNGEVKTVVFSPDNKRLISITAATLQLWDIVSGKMITNPIFFPGFENMISSAIFSPDGNKFVTISMFKPLSCVWDALTGQRLTCSQNGGYLTSALFSRDGSRVFFKSSDHHLVVWSIAPSSMVPVPDWLPDFAEAVGGYRINEHGIIESVESESIVLFKKQLENIKGPTPYSEIARWFFADKANRTISPYNFTTELHGKNDMN